MRKTSLIGHVVELHEEIRQTPRPADTIVKDFFRARHYLGSKDRRFINDVVYGIIRNRTLMQVYVERAVGVLGYQPRYRTIPSLALYIAYAVKILRENTESVLPDVAALAHIHLPDFDCMAFVQAVQRAEVPVDIVNDPVRRIAAFYSFPEFVVSEWIRRYGEAEAELLCGSLNHPAPTTVRVNTLKTNVENCQRALKREGVAAMRTELSPAGLVLERRVNVNGLESFRRGFFEMQDEGSQLLSFLLDPHPGDRVIDACAGSGGKTLHLAALMDNTGELVAVDVEDHRLRNLTERISRAGVSIASACLVGRDDATIAGWYAKANRVLIDAPCTGVGTFRRNPSAKLSLAKEMVARLSDTQRSVLNSYAGLVAPGGRLVYATCSLLESENEGAVDWFLKTHEDFTVLPAHEVLAGLGIQLEGTSRFLTLFPHKHSTDGFFAAVMERRA